MADVADMATPFCTDLREDQARLPEPCRRHVAERRVQPAVVAPVHPVEELRPEPLLRGEGPASHQLALEHPIRGLDNRVVAGVARTFSAEGSWTGRSPPFGAWPEYALERPSSPMIRRIPRLEAVAPALSRATFSLRAPYPPRDASNAPSTSGSIGSGAFGRGGCASIR